MKNEYKNTSEFSRCVGLRDCTSGFYLKISLEKAHLTKRLEKKIIFKILNKINNLHSIIYTRIIRFKDYP